MALCIHISKKVQMETQPFDDEPPFIPEKIFGVTQRSRRMGWLRLPP